MLFEDPNIIQLSSFYGTFTKEYGGLRLLSRSKGFVLRGLKFELVNWVRNPICFIGHSEGILELGRRSRPGLVMGLCAQKERCRSTL